MPNREIKKSTEALVKEGRYRYTVSPDTAEAWVGAVVLFLGLIVMAILLGSL